MFVVDKDIEKNTITVAAERPAMSSNEIIILHDVVLRVDLSEGAEVEAQFRYRQTPFKIKVISKNNNSLNLIQINETEKPAAGQSCVLYQGTHCIGGGIVT